MSEQEELAQTLLQIELEHEMIPHVIAFHRRTAAGLLGSDWLRERDARIKAETFQEAAMITDTWITVSKVHPEDGGFNEAVRGIAKDLRFQADRVVDQ